MIFLNKILFPNGGSSSSPTTITLLPPRISCWHDAPFLAASSSANDLKHDKSTPPFGTHGDQEKIISATCTNALKSVLNIHNLITLYQQHVGLEIQL